MSDLGDLYRDWNNHKKKKKESNRQKSIKILDDNNIKYTVKNNGLHLIIKCKTGATIQFWPSTGKFIQNISKTTGRGIFNLLKYIKKLEEE